MKLMFCFTFPFSCNMLATGIDFPPVPEKQHNEHNEQYFYTLAFDEGCEEMEITSMHGKGMQYL